MTEQNLDNIESLNEDVVAVDTQDNYAEQADVSEDTQEGDVVTLSKDEFNALAKSKELAENYKIRAERAEREKKNNKGKVAETSNDNSGFSKEEGKLYAKVFNSDLPEELADGALERVSKIAKLDGISLDEAYASEDFKIWKKTRIQEMKDNKAQLGASRGSQPTARKTLSTSGLSEAEHKALWADKNR